MLFNQDAEGRFSAIAASFNSAFERDWPISVLFAACGYLNFRGSCQVLWRPAPQFERYASQACIVPARIPEPRGDLKHE